MTSRKTDAATLVRGGAAVFGLIAVLAALPGSAVAALAAPAPGGHTARVERAAGVYGQQLWNSTGSSCETCNPKS
ncbi:hypothetical protein ABZ832_10580 [Streptantibioticus parmotrematis]|uniref:hypothetical protein n=1 Tax=Streptantibioticus parmotrematis TaxID=2873249 RepID=UPI0033FD035C